MNESNYAVSPYNSASFPSVARWQQMHDYITNIYQRYGGVGLTFYDCHNYPDNPILFTPGTGSYTSVSIPILLGEF